jgi:hypothetical protein
MIAALEFAGFARVLFMYQNFKIKDSLAKRVEPARLNFLDPTQPCYSDFHDPNTTI